MINFFRKIRKQLADDNKPLKYARYAIGEIVLVVIGILIALQINDWNQEKANRIIETKVLKEINRNLKGDLHEIKFDISLMDSVHNSCNDIIRSLKINSNPTDKFYNNISKLKVAPHFDPNKSGYDFLQSKGVDIVKNDSLRELISNHYELNYPYYYKYENERIQFKIHQTNPILLKYFTWLLKLDFSFSGSFEISIEDYLKIRNDGSLEKLVLATAFENDLINDRAKRIERQINNLSDLINKELELK